MGETDREQPGRGPASDEPREVVLERHRRRLSRRYGREVSADEAMLHAQRLARLILALAPPRAAKGTKP